MYILMFRDLLHLEILHKFSLDRSIFISLL